MSDLVFPLISRLARDEPCSRVKRSESRRRRYRKEETSAVSGLRRWARGCGTTFVHSARSGPASMGIRRPVVVTKSEPIPLFISWNIHSDTPVQSSRRVKIAMAAPARWASCNRLLCSLPRPIFRLECSTFCCLPALGSKRVTPANFSKPSISTFSDPLWRPIHASRM